MFILARCVFNEVTFVEQLKLDECVTWPHFVEDLKLEWSQQKSVSPLKSILWNK